MDTQGLEIPALTIYPSESHDGNITVNITAINGATRYVIQEANNSLFTISVVEAYNGTSSGTKYFQRGNGTYYYRAMARNATANSSWSSVSSCRVQVYNVTWKAMALALPSTSLNGTFFVSWTAVAGADRYVLQKDANGPEFASPLAAFEGPGNSTWLTININGTYYFRVKAAQGDVDGQWSPVKAISVRIPRLPAPVLAGPPTSGNGTFLLTWEAVPGATNYVVQESKSEMFSPALTVFDRNLTRALIANRTNGIYYYRVRALGNNPSLWSEAVAVTVEIVTFKPLETPELAAPLTSPTGTYTIYWTSVPNATGYVLELSPNAQFKDAVSENHTATSRLFVGLQNGTCYYRVRAANSTNIGDWSAPKSVTVSLVYSGTQINVGDGTTLTLYVGLPVAIKVGDASHVVTVLSIENNSAVVEVKSTPRQVVLNAGDTRGVDTDADTEPELEITLNGVTNGAVSLTFAPAASEDEGLPFLLIAGLVMAIAALAIAVIIVRRRDKSGEE